jgi:hypothetical protein
VTRASTLKGSVLLHIRVCDPRDAIKNGGTLRSRLKTYFTVMVKEFL